VAYGFQTGSPLPAELEVSLVKGMAPEPSAFRSQTLVAPLGFAASAPSTARCEVNAIFLPSGDHVIGEAKLIPVVVSRVTAKAPVPLALIVQTLSAELILEASLPSRARPTCL
jgi:hypothetical protein